jgi:hypothetical protein
MARGGPELEAQVWDAAARTLGRFGRVESVPAIAHSGSIDRVARLVLADGRLLELRLDLRRIPTPGRTLQEQAIALAALRLAASPVDAEVANALVIVVPTIPVGFAEGVRRLLAPLGTPTLNIILVSAADGWWCWLPGVGIDAVEPDRTSARGVDRNPPMREIPLTAVNQWLLKILLLGRAPTAWWSGPRLGETKGRDLAGIATVGSSTAYRLVAALTARGWLDHGLRLRRTDALVRYWLDHARHAQTTARPVRPLFGGLEQPEAAQAWLRKQGPVADCPWAMGSWSACAAHGVAMVTGTTRLSIHAMGSVESLMRAWELTPCEERDADFVIEACEPSMVRPLAGGSVVIDGIPVVDIWQAALDVARDPGRGGDQAWAIAQRIIDLEDASDG